MKKYKIGIDARMYGPKQTGIGTYISNLIYQIELIDKTNEYFIFLLPHNFDLIKNLPSNFHKIKVYSHWYTLREQTVFLKKILSYKLDLIHFTHFNLPVLYPRKFILTIHDITPKFFPGHKMGKSWYRRKAYDFIIKKGIKKAEKIIVPSQKTKRDLVNFYHAEENKIAVIYEGINKKKSIEQRKDFLENYSQNKEIARKEVLSIINPKLENLPYIFYVGVWRNHKNLPNLIRAFDILTKKYDFKGFLILGGTEDSHYPETRREWQRRGLEGRILRPGFISSEKLTLFYEGADVFVLPSLYEGFGLVCLEALNQGTSVACSGINPLKEILGSAAIYFDPRNPEDMAYKINKLIKSRKLQKEGLEKAQDILKKFSWEKMAETTVKVYKEKLPR